jgi:hypothetical protein
MPWTHASAAEVEIVLLAQQHPLEQQSESQQPDVQQSVAMCSLLPSSMDVDALY